MVVEVFLLIFLVGTSTFFAGVEIAMLGVGALNLVRGNRKKMYYLYTNKEKIVITCLIGSNVGIIGSTILVDHLFLSAKGSSMVILGLFLEVIVFFLLAELLPKIISQKLGVKILEYLYYPINLAYYIFSPLSFLFLSFTNYIAKFLSKPTKFRREDIFHFLSTHMHDQDITKALMDMNLTTVKEIMTPLSEIYSIRESANIKELISLLEEALYTRFPVYENRSDRIIGYVHISDILTANKEDKISHFVRNTEYISEFLSVDKLLFQMQENQLSILFVVSEFGSVIGLVTLEDVAEKLVGDIHIKEQPQPEIIKVSKRDKNVFTILGGLDIDDFNTFFNLNVKKEGFETLSGFLMKKTMSIPKTGNEFKFNFGSLKVLEGDGKEVKRLQFNKKATKLLSKKQEKIK